MNRALKEKMRTGPKGTQALPAKAAPKPAMNIQNYDGRANTAKGQFETQATRGTSADGMQVQWEGITK